MNLRLSLATALLGSLAAAASPARAADVVTGWVPMQLTQQTCLQTGSQVASRIGFQASTSPQTMFAWRGQENISVRCIADHQIAVFFVYLQSSEAEGREIVEQLRMAYTGGGAPPAPAPNRPGNKF